MPEYGDSWTERKRRNGGRRPAAPGRRFKALWKRYREPGESLRSFARASALQNPLHSETLAAQDWLAAKGLTS